MPKSKPPSSHSDDDALDPLFLNARREFRASLIVFVLFGLWVIGVSWFLGRPREPDSTDITLGMPTWAFWGVAIPWVTANLFTFWFCFRFMADDPLRRVDAETDEAGVEDGTR